METLRIIKWTFDATENRTAEAVSSECVGTFVAGNGLTAHGNAAKWLAAQPPVSLRLAWNGGIYPQYTTEVEHADDGA